MNSRNVRIASGLRAAALICSISALFFSEAVFLHADTASDVSKKIMKTRIDDLKAQIDIFQNEIDQKSTQQDSVSNEISILGADIKKIELQVQATELSIAQLDGDIGQKEIDIDGIQKQVDAKRIMLGKFLEQLYERRDQDEAQIFFGEQSFSDFFAKTNDLESFENQIKEIQDQLTASRNSLKNERDALMQQKSQKENLRWMQRDQQQSLETEKQMENQLMLKINDEKSALQANVSSLQAELANLQALGVPINMDEAISAAKYASGVTGVAPEFLLGVLRVESGLGTNVGGGKYKSDMNPAQWDTFKKICKELGLDPDKTPVSRRACYNQGASDGCGGWGGAMGPAQFMPATWLGYKTQVEKATGHSPANPWDIRDSMVALGLKVGAVDGVKAGNRSAWAKAAGMYLAGGNWENYPWYSDRVLHYADGFKKIMKNS